MMVAPFMIAIVGQTLAAVLIMVISPIKMGISSLSCKALTLSAVTKYTCLFFCWMVLISVSQGILVSILPEKISTYGESELNIAAVVSSLLIVNKLKSTILATPLF